jgi:CHAD domain-containing protein
MDALQEALGAYNDTVVRRSLLSEFAAAPQARENPAIAFAADQIVGTQHSLGHRLLKNAAKTLSKLKSAKAFWKVEQSEFETHSRRLQSRTAVQISGPMPHADAA